jgi:hypothetical protein
MMKVPIRSIRIYAPLIDGSEFPIVDPPYTTGREIVDRFAPDVRPPIHVIVIETLLPDGRTTRLSIPNDGSGEASLRFSDE